MKQYKILQLLLLPFNCGAWLLGTISRACYFSFWNGWFFVEDEKLFEALKQGGLKDEEIDTILGGEKI